MNPTEKLSIEDKKEVESPAILVAAKKDKMP